MQIAATLGKHFGTYRMDFLNNRVFKRQITHGWKTRLE